MNKQYVMDNFSLEGRKAIVTGAAQGMGRSIAEALHDAGAIVALVDYSASVKETAKQMDETGKSVLPFQADLSKREEIDRVFSEVMQAFDGHIDILVNNAGITKDGLMLRMKDEDFDRVIQTNLRGAFVCVREAAKIMTRQRHGRIINISSVVGQMGNAGQINYASAKAGLIGLTKSAAKELAGRNVTVNAVAPGFVETDMTAGLPDDVRAAYIDAIPLKRLGTPQDIADAVAFLASPGAGYITGQVIAVNGGMYC